MKKRITPKFKRNVRVLLEDEKWHYYKSYHNALRAIDKELYEWFTVEEPVFNPRSVLREMKLLAEKRNGNH